MIVNVNRKTHTEKITVAKDADISGAILVFPPWMKNTQAKEIMPLISLEKGKRERKKHAKRNKRMRIFVFLRKGSFMIGSKFRSGIPHSG
jgi:hypothetical protein